MHVRITTTRRGAKTYRSVQLAQSYRAANGKPVARVLASLGSLSDLEIENLKRAVAASRSGRAVVIGAEPRAARVKRSLAYLDVATCLQTWRRWHLTELIDELVPDSEQHVSVGEVIGALAVQRCVAPASKLEASRWYPKTALPELQAVVPSQFNNTRIHRALETLASIELRLQEQLARAIAAEQSRFVSLFLDCTDTWFVGRGPELAANGPTKEGLFRRKIGIALMCDQRGFPLRWATVEGNHSEVETMLDMIDAAARQPWAEQLPIVVDRAMGRGVTVEALSARGVRFVTAVPAPEIAGYSARMPVGAFNGIALDDEHAVERLQEAATEVGFQAWRKRCLMDFGVIAKGEGGQEALASWLIPSRAVAMLTAAQTIRREMDAGSSVEDLETRYGCNQRTSRRWLELLALTDEVQKRILAGEADNIPPQELQRIARLRESAQPPAFDALRAAAAAADQPRLSATRKLADFCQVPRLRVRAIAIFDPARFVEQRSAAMRALNAIEQLVESVNESLTSPHSRMTDNKAIGKVEHAIRQDKLNDVFDVDIEQRRTAGRTVSRVVLRRNDDVWSRRRQTDGLTLIVAHPDVLGSAEEIVSLYFAKDRVEKDFQTIKSVLDLRPVNHQTDPKVRAHVTICMLALLLQLSIEQRIRQAGLEMTGASALDTLESARLNLFAGRVGVYSVTEPDTDQRRVLKALNLQQLADDERLNEILHPR